MLHRCSAKVQLELCRLHPIKTNHHIIYGGVVWSCNYNATIANNEPNSINVCILRAEYWYVSRAVAVGYVTIFIYIYIRIYIYIYVYI